MKRMLCFLAALPLCLCLAVPAAAAADPAEAPGLKFRQDGTFKILQITDTQEFILSGAITQEFIYDLVKSEKPDLIVLTGDNVSTGGANSFPKFIAKIMAWFSIHNLMKVFDKVYKKFGVPVTMVFGNHDNEAAEKGVTRADQFAMYAKHKCFIGYYAPEADEGTGDKQGQHYGTHNLIVKDKTGTTPKFNLWMFDSGSYDPAGGYSWVQTPQIEWFKETHKKWGKLPSFAFQHIIVPEIYDYLTQGKLPAGTQGELREDPCPGKTNQGQYAALCANNVLALFVGHDHTNTFELYPQGKTALINSPCSGFGSYGDIDLRGARIITLKDDMSYTTRLLRYQNYYGPDKLREARLAMYQKQGPVSSALDWISFQPLFWLLGVFSCP